jgi:hypothetical protein
VREIRMLGSTLGDESKKYCSLGEGTGAKASANGEAPQRASFTLTHTQLLDTNAPIGIVNFQYLENVNVPNKLRYETRSCALCPSGFLMMLISHITTKIIVVISSHLS